MNKKALTILISIALLTSSLITACSASETFTVPVSQETDRIINLNAGDTVQGSLEVSGGSGNDINFIVTDNHNNIILEYNHTSVLNFSFMAQKGGSYTLHFINSFSLDSAKSVTLDYNVVNMTIVYAITVTGIAIIVTAIIIAYLYGVKKKSLD
jgi:emp24/gp25L/p24 family/GOLD